MKNTNKLHLASLALLSANMMMPVSAVACDPALEEEFGFCDETPPICECIAGQGYGGEFSDFSSAEVVGSSIEIIANEGYDGGLCIFTATDNGDGDSGIDRVELVPGAVNMALVPFGPISGSFVQFILEPIDPGLPAVGEINAFDQFGNACAPAFQLNHFDPFGGLTRIDNRNLRLFLNRPPGVNTDIEGVRCIETTTPESPLPSDLSFESFNNGFLELNIQIESAGNGSKNVCCEYRDEVGNVSPPACAVIVLDQQAPPAPDDVTGRAKPGKVDLLWSLVDGVESYNVFRATVSGGPYTPIGSVTNYVFVDLNANAGETYFYVLQSVLDSMLSEQSSEFEITVPLESVRRRR